MTSPRPSAGRPHARAAGCLYVLLATIGLADTAAVASYFENADVFAYFVAFLAIGVLGLTLLVGRGLIAIMPVAVMVGLAFAALSFAAIAMTQGAALQLLLVPIILALCAALLALWGLSIGGPGRADVPDDQTWLTLGRHFRNTRRMRMSLPSGPRAAWVTGQLAMSG